MCKLCARSWRRECRHQFSLRQVFALLCVLAALFGVASFHIRLEEARRRSAAPILWANGYVEHEFLSPGMSAVVLEYSGLGDCRLIELTDILKKEAGLRVLCLGHTDITDAGLIGLVQLQQIRDLRLNGTAVTDAGMEAIGRLAALENLSLGRTHVTGKGIARLEGLARLRSLNLSGTRIEDEDLEYLCVLAASLEVLDVSETSVTGEGLKRLISLPRLRELDISETRIDGAAVRWIPKLTSLRVLYIDSTSIDRKSVDWLKKRSLRLDIRMTGYPLDYSTTRVHDEELTED